MDDLQKALEVALAHHQAGRTSEAEAIYRQILAAAPEHPEALHYLGTLGVQVGNIDQGLAMMQRSLALSPRLAHFHSNYGMMLVRAGRHQEAIRILRRAIEIQPNLTSAHFNLAFAYHQAARFSEAEAIYRRILAAAPDHPDALHYLGTLGVQVGHVGEGLAMMERSLALLPGSAHFHSNYGMMLVRAGRHEQAVNVIRRAIELQPDLANAHFNLSAALVRSGNRDEAFREVRTAIALDPNLIEARTNYAFMLTDIGDLEEAIAEYRRITQDHPRFIVGWSNLLLTLHYHSRVSPGQLFDEHARFGKMIAQTIPRMIPATLRDPDPNRRLKIGYFSPDFRDHPIASFIAPVLEHHDRSAVEVFAYAQLQEPDGVTERLWQHVDQWRDITWKGDDQAAELIREDRIDILVELAGHTTNARMELLARRPAPIQITWMGYPGTTGMSAIDYRITDAIADPPGEADDLHVEKLVRLPGCFLCFTPPLEAISIADGRSVDQDQITFGCFNRMAKVSDVTMDLWARVLQQTPGARLVLKGGGMDASTSPHWLDRLDKHGIDRSRIIPLMQTSNRHEHLSAMRQVDIALDTFPYNATTITCEWLWMGVPIITLAGHTHASRVGKSLLSAVGLRELIAHSPDEYVEFAVKLAADMSKLRELRRSLRARLLTSQLTDGPTFTRNLETAYRSIWQQSLNRASQH